MRWLAGTLLPTSTASGWRSGTAFDDAVFSSSLRDMSAPFAEVTFDGSELTFYGAEFRNGYKSFSDSRFLSGTVAFDRVKLDNATLLFTRSVFAGATVTFYNAAFTAGSVSFFGVKFSGGRVSFGELHLEGVSFISGTVSLEGIVVELEGVLHLPWARYTGGGTRWLHTDFDGRSEYDFYVRTARFSPDVTVRWGTFAPDTCPGGDGRLPAGGAADPRPPWTLAGDRWSIRPVRTSRRRCRPE